jgi:Flp pilus assembly protein TadG
MMTKVSPFPRPASERRVSERGVILLLASMAMPMLVSMLGLGVDASLMYSVKTRLQLACDGASLAAARGLSTGADFASQRLSAINNATNWFNRNFAGNYMGATGTSLSNVDAFQSPTEPMVRNVVVTAQTTAPTYFMRFWGRTGTNISATAIASRRDAVIMMVLDRSGSMNSNGGCPNMKAAAKRFTGMFSAGRDRIGMVTFSDTFYLASSPVTNFQTVLGFTPDVGTGGNGIIDQITCGGNTGIPHAVSIGYNELYRTALPGALNVMLFFTDGLPNTLIFDARTGSSSATSRTGFLLTTSTCQDSANRPMTNVNANMHTNPRNWTTGVSWGSGSVYPDVGAGPIGSLLTGDDPADNTYDGWRQYRFTSPTQNGNGSYINAAGCGSGNGETNTAFLPDADIFGNSMFGYIGGITTANINGGNRIQPGGINLRNGAFNAAANAANFARTARALPNSQNFPGVMIFAVGMGSGVNHELLQRMSNDGTGVSGVYPPFTGVDPNQPAGTYVYSPSGNGLTDAFLRIASMILRLAQ